MSALTPTQDSMVYQLAAQMMAAATSDADTARIDRALDLVSGVERMARPDLFLVTSQTVADAAYRVHQGQCNCPDASKRDARRCKHVYATVIFQQLERMEAERLDPTLSVVVEPEDSILDLWPGEPCEIDPRPTCILCHQHVEKVTKYGECLPCVNAYMFPEGA